MRANDFSASYSESHKLCDAAGIEVREVWDFDIDFGDATQPARARSVEMHRHVAYHALVWECAVA